MKLFILLLLSFYAAGQSSAQQKRQPKDCYELLLKRPNATSGQYSIYPTGQPLQVWCDMETEGGGWTLIHNRLDGSVNFYRPWSDYKQGFRNSTNMTNATEFYLGNDNIHHLTFQGKYELRIDMQAHVESAFAEFASFSVADETKLYKLQISGYKPSSTAGDSLTGHNGYSFSTYDGDHDAYRGSCASRFRGAWWYSSCHASNLNGLYLYTKANKGVVGSYANSMCYYSYKGYYYALQSASMKIRPHQPAKDCWDIQKNYPRAKSGVYTVYLGPETSQTGTAVHCDMTTDGGGWTTILRRLNGSVDFYRDFSAYEAGFGDKQGEHWLGLKNLNILSSQRKYELRVDVESNKQKRYAEYSRMVVLDAASEYRLYISGYNASSTAGDSMKTHNAQTFSARDRNTNTQCSGNCAISSKGGWWYSCCHKSNLMGEYSYTTQGKSCARSYGAGVIWSSFTGFDYSLKTAEMKLRPQPPCKKNGGVRCNRCL